MATATNAPTAPLPASAAMVLAKLERSSIAPAVVEAVTRYEAAALHVIELSDLAAIGDLSDLDADSLAHAEDLMAGARAVLAKAGRLDLVGQTPEPDRSVTRYGILLARVAELTMKDRLTPAEFNGLADAQAELTRLHEQLEQAGQLHLVSS